MVYTVINAANTWVVSVNFALLLNQDLCIELLLCLTVRTFSCDAVIPHYMCRAPSSTCRCSVEDIGEVGFLTLSKRTWNCNHEERIGTLSPGIGSHWDNIIVWGGVRTEFNPVSVQLRVQVLFVRWQKILVWWMSGVREIAFYVLLHFVFLFIWLAVQLYIAFYCPGVNMFEAYRQRCSAEDLSRLKAALCSGEVLSCKITMSK